MDTKITHTVRSYLESPMVKSSAFNIRTIKEDLTRRYEKLVSEKKIEMKNVAIDGKKYYVHYVIGTESDDRENNYDVIIEFFPKNRIVATESTVKNYNIKFFTNIPSFVFTFAYVYNEKGLLSEEFKNKYNSKVFKMKPKEKNPYKIVNYDKALYFALLDFTKDAGVKYNKGYLSSKKNCTLSQLKNKIRNTDTILMEIRRENSRLKESRRKEKESLKAAKKAVKVTPKSSTGVTRVITPKNKITASKSNSSSRKSSLVRRITARK